MIGLSRKGFLGELTGTAAAADRLVPSVVGALLAAQRGATFLRVHDVAATRQALAVADALGALARSAGESARRAGEGGGDEATDGVRTEGDET
jgi:dihydropteroate synthase